ncbi:MAG: TIGR00282 family metallophosphoesterase [Candidatus Altimarinota bacterium]
MKILFLGDVFGKPGRQTVAKVLPEMIKEKQPDLVIANVENIHHGKGVSSSKIEEMQKAGVDFFTSGNHIWKVNQIYEYLDQEEYPLLRPGNYPDKAPGRGDKIIETKSGKKVLVINLMGRVYMPAQLGDPFAKAEQILEKYKAEGLELGKGLAAIFVDFHAEAGSEKMAMGHYLDGRISALVGTHTHIPTADEQILPGGTAYQTDTGMNGCYDSVIGVKKEEIIENFLTQMPVKHTVAEGPTVFNSVLVELDENGLAKKIERIQRYLQ